MSRNLPSPRMLLFFWGVLISGCRQDTAQEEYFATPIPRREADPQLVAELRRILPEGYEIPVDIMRMIPPEGMKDVYDRMMKSMAENSELFLEAVKNSGEGPLPYEEWMGITKTEYDAVLSTPLMLEVADQAKVTFHWLDSDIIAFSNFDKLEDLYGLTIHLKDNEVCTPFDRLKNSKAMHVSEDKSVIGPWDGRTWRYDPGPNDLPMSLSLSVGRFREKDRCFIDYQVRLLTSPPTKISYLLFFDAPHDDSAPQ